MKDQLGDMMKQVQDLQKQMEQAKKEMEAKEVIAEAGAGMVKIVSNYRHDIKSVILEPELLNEEKTVIEDLLRAAMNDLTRKIEKKTQMNVADLASSFGSLKGMGFPFSKDDEEE